MFPARLVFVARIALIVGALSTAITYFGLHGASFDLYGACGVVLLLMVLNYVDGQLSGRPVFLGSGRANPDDQWDVKLLTHLLAGLFFVGGVLALLGYLPLW
ncbi:hypothetical protein IP84_14425 [beta proteobacterium AAP99]|nr:hypothetical protein IP84_14425 [beta proteobacterium AAP99]